MKDKKPRLISFTKKELFILYYTANGFKEIFEQACLLYQQQIFSTEVNSLPFFVVNGMFAIELYLKIICAYEKMELSSEDEAKVIKTHNIQILFNELPDTVKTEVLTELKNEGIEQKELNDFFEEHKNDFEGWRYPGEKDKGTDGTIIGSLLKVLYTRCKKIISRPEIYKFAEDLLPEFSMEIFKEWHSKIE